MSKFKVGDSVKVIKMKNSRIRLVGLTGNILKEEKMDLGQMYLVCANNNGPLIQAAKGKHYYWRPGNITWRFEEELELT